MPGDAPGKFLFSSSDLPSELDDQARFSFWRDLCTKHYCSLELSRPEHQPFKVRFQAAQFGSVSVGKFDGTVNHAARTERDVSADDSDDFFFCLNRGGRM